MGMKLLIFDQSISVENSIHQLLVDGKELVSSVSIVRSIMEASRHIHTFQPDLVFIDISVDESNLELLKYINYRGVKIVLISNNGTHAIKAIRIAAFDFLLKPIEREDFRSVIIKAKTPVSCKNEVDMEDNTILMVQTKKGKVPIVLEQVIKIKASGSYSSIHCVNNKQYLVCKVIGYYESKLPKSDFFRIHHSCVINRKFIESFEVNRSCIIHLIESNKELVSQRKKGEFLKFIQSQ